jgi:hypothetical protein
MTNKAFAVLIAGLCLVVLALPAWADETTPESKEGRYTLSKIADFVRLDMQTGEVSTCSQRTIGWAYQAVPEDRARKRDSAPTRRRPCLLKTWP